MVARCPKNKKKIPPYKGSQTEPLWLKFQQISTDLQTAVTRVLDEQWRIQKKEKSSEFDAKDDDYIKSGPAVKV